MWYNMIPVWYDMIWYDMMYIIWYDMLWRQIMCNRKQCVYNLVKKSIKSANVMSLCMLRRHYIKSTICARHIMSLFFPGTFCNSPYLQAFVTQWQWCSPVAFCSAVRACWNNINNQTCGVLKTRLARTNFWNSERTMRIDTDLWFFL